MRPSDGDVLSDVLRAIRLTGAIYFDFELSSPWVAEAPPSRELLPLVMPDAGHLIEYHVIAGGSCWGHPVGGDPVRLVEGDIVVFPQGHAHVLSSEPGMRAEPDMSAFSRREGPLPLVFESGGGGPQRARVVCGFLGCDAKPFNPLLSALPGFIHLQTSKHPSTAWLRSLIETAVTEARAARPGTENVLARLSELMFVEVVRRYVASLPPGQTGWLAGLGDPVVGRVLVLMHGAPADDWSLDRLAHDVGVSRSVLAERFTHVVGQPVMQYLAGWRMQLASRMLADGGQVSEVAARVGYESEAAFSRAFKKVVGTSPGSWRRSQQAAASAATP